MKEEFYLYNGLAGDEHELAVYYKNGFKVSKLFNRFLFFYNFRLNCCKKQLKKEWSICYE